MTSLEQSWSRAWEHLQLSPPGDLFSTLIAAYNEPHRSYHSLQHLKECVAHFSEAIDLAVQPGEVELALWFHDAIYDIRGQHNELRSAEWAKQILIQAGAGTGVQQRVHGLIMATRHDAIPRDSDQQLIVDIDLAILGATPARFNEYDEQVRTEYSWVPSFLYNMKRKDVLRSFLIREQIYSTCRFRELYEHQARVNLQTAVS
jgi:predicted metal-dependent HD superfamily phosphohydrolase